MDYLLEKMDNLVIPGITDIAKALKSQDLRAFLCSGNGSETRSPFNIFITPAGHNCAADLHRSSATACHAQSLR